jgi:hypothetical protein
MALPLHVRLTLALAAALALGALALSAASAGVRAPEARDPSRFAADVTALRDAGFTLRELSLETDADGLTTLVLILGHARKGGEVAERFEFVTGDWGERVIGYTRAPTPAPTHHRVYPAADELLEAFAEAEAGAAISINSDCGGWYLSIDGTDVFIDDLSYYEVVERWSSAAAQRALAQELRESLGEDFAISGLDSDQEARTVTVTLGSDHDGERELIIEHDAHGAIVAVERRDWPTSRSDARLPGSEALRKRLAKAKAIKVVSFDGDGATLVLTPAKGKAVVLTGSDFIYPEEEGCGC